MKRRKKAEGERFSFRVDGFYIDLNHKRVTATFEMTPSGGVKHLGNTPSGGWIPAGIFNRMRAFARAESMKKARAETKENGRIKQIQLPYHL